MPKKSKAKSNKGENYNNQDKDYPRPGDYNVFKDGKTLHGKQVRPQIIDNYKQYYRVCSPFSFNYIQKSLF